MTAMFSVEDEQPLTPLSPKKAAQRRHAELTQHLAQADEVRMDRGLGCAARVP